MLNKNNERELAYLVVIDEIRPIEGRDRVECAIVNGWTIMVRKNQFKPGDIGVYFEIDSKVPEKEPFDFLSSKHYKIKTQKYKTPNGQFWSQGLLMSPVEDFGWGRIFNPSGDVAIVINNESHYPTDESRFLTKELEVTYAVEEDNKRKANSPDRYKAMAARHPALFKKPLFKWLMRRPWGRKLLFLFFGKKKDKRGWPAYIKKTDEERCQNLAHILFDNGPWHDETWIATEKIDGTSTTFSMKRGRGLHKNEFYICSRNVVFDKPDKKCFYDVNVYQEMAEKYNIEKVLTDLLQEYPKADWVTIQGETYGKSIQKREYGKDDHDFVAFNLIMSNTGRWNTIDMCDKLRKYKIPCVPILSISYKLPETIEELLAFAEGNSMIDGKEREGIVFRSLDGEKSFKAVSNSFLYKYHQ